MLHLEVRNESIDGKKLLQIKELWDVLLYVHAYATMDTSASPTKIRNFISEKIKVFIVSPRKMPKRLVIAFIGKENSKWTGKNRVWNGFTPAYW